tara:strand:+ start:3280 stop:3726 length:447 start_codon:yes stop_codon:yes gene_type:complete
MALPASGPISMSQVAAEFDSEVGANMSLSASAANLSTPVASNIFLAASFYGQSAVTLTAFSVNTNSGESYAATPAGAGEACENMSEGGGTPATYYHDGSGTLPTTGDMVYTNSGGTTTPDDGLYGAVSGRATSTFETENGESGLQSPC